MKGIKERTFTGVKTKEVREYEIRHRELARRSATEGFVLLKNDGQLLPLKKNSKVALYGAGAVRTIKGGTGSGDVNERSVVSIQEGMRNAGFDVTTEEWLSTYENIYQKAREDWRDRIWEELNGADVLDFFNVYSANPFHFPAGTLPSKTEADIAIFVLSRIAGEGADRFAEKGDYYLNDEEEAILAEITKLYAHTVVILNVGGVQDCSFLDRYKVDAVLMMSQAGMESGNALADILTGDVTPSGKLTDSWAFKYEDYPNSENYSHNNNNVEKEFYNEGIYVGYRYFDTFEIPVRYGFGYGMSYTEFESEVVSIEQDKADKTRFTASVNVKNIGDKYSGKEVIQLYISCPQKKQEKEFRRLAGFKKTGLLAPGASEVVEIGFSVDQMISYSEAEAAWVLEKGVYAIYIGNDLETSRPSGSIRLSDDVVRVKTTNICPVKDSFEEFKNDREKVSKRRKELESELEKLPVIELLAGDIGTEVIEYGKGDFLDDSEEMDFVNTLTTEQLILLATGDPVKGQGSNLGSSGFSVPGSAAETSRCAVEQGLDSIVLADGPAGLRLTQDYQVVNDQIIQKSFEMSIENGFLYRGEVSTEGDTYYQYCTAIPVGTMLAQSWDPVLVEEVGKAIGEEMEIFNVTLWLAPGMCIHRNPLCGRNFEYYSEDPFVSGIIAAAMTNGVQTHKGCGTTIKHFCCNNQEDNRMQSDSILSERALREIYIKGFEIAIKESAPLSMMTSYNLVNGVHAANNYDICTKVARDEWKYEGVIMTDWTTTHLGPDCTASGCMRAGNDLVMPGIPNDHDNMRKELEEGTLSLYELKRSIAHLTHVVWQ